MIQALPHVNSALNALAALLLITAYVMIRRGHWRIHAGLMLGATVVSATFLAGYLIHKWYAGERSTGEMKWLPVWLRIVYLCILLPHLLLAVTMLPMIGMVLYRAAHRDWERHRQLARPTLAIWLYVSITGVVIYGMLYHLFPALKR